MREINVPELPDVEKVKVVRWLKRVGEEVKTGEAVAEVEADKAVFVIESQVSGTMAAILAREGEIVRSGQVIGLVKER